MGSKLTLISAIILTTFLFSCAPKDDKLPPKPGNNVNPQSNDSTMNQTELHKLTFLTFDRTFEAIALLKAALNPQYAEQLKLTVGELAQVDDVTGDSAKLLKNIASSTTIATAEAWFVTQMNYQIEEMRFNDDGEFVKLSLKSNDTTEIVNQGFLATNGRPIDFKTVTMADRIVIRKSNKKDLYSLEVLRVEAADSKKDKSSVINSQIKALFAWDGQIESLDNEIAVTALQFKVVRTGQKKGALTLKALTTNLSVKLNQCVSVFGDMVLTSDVIAPKETKPSVPKGAFQVSVKDSSVEIPQEKFKSKAQPCESRPLVDLTRML